MLRLEELRELDDALARLPPPALARLEVLLELELRLFDPDERRPPDDPPLEPPDD